MQSEPLNRLLPFALLLCVVLACAESPKPKPAATTSNQNSPEPSNSTAPAEPAPEAAAITVTAPDLFAAYKANEVAADEAYKGKVLRITGKIENIGKDIIDTMYVTLNSGAGFSIGSVQCMFADEHKNELMQLKKGQTVTVVGLCNGKFGNVLVKDCYLEK